MALAFGRRLGLFGDLKGSGLDNLKELLTQRYKPLGLMNLVLISRFVILERGVWVISMPTTSKRRLAPSKVRARLLRGLASGDVMGVSPSEVKCCLQGRKCRLTVACEAAHGID